MNVKIKASGVVNILGTDYDRIYTSLKDKLGDGEEQLFSERIPGHEYLQWNLPEEGWTALNFADPLMEGQVRIELDKRKQRILSLFGSNLIMGNNILSVPDDSYIYYRVEPDGRLNIKLTAWGYRFPERVGMSPATGYITNPNKKIPVRILVKNNDELVPGYELFLNNMRRSTNEQGYYPVGDLPVGYQFELKVNDEKQLVTVAPGEGDIVIDITPEISGDVDQPGDIITSGGGSTTGEGDIKNVVTQKVRIAFEWDGKIIPGVPFTLDETKYRTGVDGFLILDKAPEVNSVLDIETVGGKRLSLKVEQGKEDYVNDLTEFFTAHVSVTKDGVPQPATECEVEFNGIKHKLTTGTDGCAKITLPLLCTSDGTLSMPQPPCLATCKGVEQQILPVSDNQILNFNFAFDTPVPVKKKSKLEWTEILGLLVFVLMVAGTYLWCYDILFSL